MIFYGLSASLPHFSRPTELPGQTGPLAWFCKSAEPLARIPTWVSLQGAMQSARNPALAAMSPTPFSIPILSPGVKPHRFPCRFTPTYSPRSPKVGLPGSGEAGCLRWALSFPPEKPQVSGGPLSACCAGTVEGQHGQSLALPLLFLMLSFSVSATQGGGGVFSLTPLFLWIIASWSCERD